MTIQEHLDRLRLELLGYRRAQTAPPQADGSRRDNVSINSNLAYPGTGVHLRRPYLRLVPVQLLAPLEMRRCSTRRNPRLLVVAYNMSKLCLEWAHRRDSKSRGSRLSPSFFPSSLKRISSLMSVKCKRSQTSKHGIADRDTVAILVTLLKNLRQLALVITVDPVVCINAEPELVSFFLCVLLAVSMKSIDNRSRRRFAVFGCQYLELRPPRPKLREILLYGMHVLACNHNDAGITQNSSSAIKRSRFPGHSSLRLECSPAIRRVRRRRR